MTDLDFLKDICAAKPDDAPRLAFADWLDESAAQVECPQCEGKGTVRVGFISFGSDAPCPTCSGARSVADGKRERAEFIRVQCELADKTEGVDGGDDTWQDRVTALGRRERELFEKHGAEWFGRNACLTPPSERECQSGGQYRVVRRGFVEVLICTAADWMRLADQLVWRPGEKCRACKGTRAKRILRSIDYPDGVTCSTCRGSGERPCPPTAQPVREVRLTTFPDPAEYALEDRWPGVTFTLP